MLFRNNMKCRTAHAISAFALLICFGLLLAGCAAHTSIQPVGKGKLNANFSIGGPIVAAFDTHIPIPYATVGADYGLSEKINLDGAFHLLSLPYGIIGMDIGATWFPHACDCTRIPTIGIEPRVLILASVKSNVGARIKAYPILSASSSWHWDFVSPYIGFDFVVPLSRADYDEDAPDFIISPYIGARWKLSERISLLTEIKYNGANVPTDKLAVEYTNISGYGAISPLIAIERSF